jgi:uncharacterized protein (TIGR02677 family)
LDLVLERLHDSRFKKVNRTADLLQLAEWFTACPDDESAHRLAQTAFGMFSARHIAERLEDPTAVAASTSWWDAPAADISVSMRERGDSKKLGRTARIVDHSGTKRQLDEARRRAEAARSQALSAFVGRGAQRLSQLGTLDEMEFEALLGLLDRLLAAEPDDQGVRRATSADGRLRMELVPPRDRTRTIVRTERGALHLYDWELCVAQVVRRTTCQSELDQREDDQREGVA